MNIGGLLDREFETTAGPRTVRQMIEGTQPTVFISYPMDFTPVCTKQLCSYRDNWAEMGNLPVRWWGINQADPEKHNKFKAQKSLPFELISDPAGDLLRALGMWGMLRTRRGFAVVSPGGEVLGTNTIFPFFYRKHETVAEFVRRYV